MYFRAYEDNHGAFLPSAAVDADEYCSMRPPVCPSVFPSRTTLPLLFFKDSSYQPEIWWDDAQYHETDLLWNSNAHPIFARQKHFEIFHDMLGQVLRYNDS